MKLLLESSIAQHPILQALINDETPNREFLGASLDLEFVVQIKYSDHEEIFDKTIKLWEVCCLYGKVDHLKALLLQNNTPLGSQWYLTAIKQAAQNDHVSTIEFLESHLTVSERKEAVKANNYEAIRSAAADGHTQVIKHYHSHLTEDECRESVKAYNYVAINSAANIGNSDMIEYLASCLSLPERKAMVLYDNYSLVKAAAANGHTSAVKSFESYLSPKQCREMIESDEYNIIELVARKGSFATFKHFEKYFTHSERPSLLMAMNYRAFRSAACGGHIKMLKHFARRLTPEQIKAAIKAYDYSAIIVAASQGDLNTVQYLASFLTAAELSEIIQYDGYKIIKKAAENGHISTIEYLGTYLNDKERKDACGYLVIRLAARAGQLATIKYLETHFTLEERKEMVKRNNYDIIYSYVPMTSVGLAILEHFELYLTLEERKKMLKNDNYAVFQHAVKGGSVDMLKHLETLLTAKELRAALRVKDYEAIEWLTNSSSKGEKAFPHLLGVDTILAYMESKDNLYGKRFVYPYVEKRLQTLRQEKAAHEHANLEFAFDLNDDAARHGFYMLRNLIRRGVARESGQAEDQLDNIKFLLSIPAIYNLCSKSVNPQEGGEKNELLNLALQIGNQDAVALLMTIPKVQRKASKDKRNENNDSKVGKKICLSQIFFEAPQVKANLEEDKGKADEMKLNPSF